MLNTRLCRLLLCAAAAIVWAGATEPWTHVPEGWVFLQQEGIDTFSGLYHDRISDACIGVTVAQPFVVQPLRESTEAALPQYSGVPYYIRVDRYSACPDGRVVDASFFPAGNGAVWSFSGHTCGQGQYDRVRQFLLNGRSQPSEDQLLESGRRHSKDVLVAVPIGSSFTDVRKVLGPTSEAECHPGGGFTAFWTEDSRPHYRDWRFTFNGEHQLVSIEPF